MTARGGEIVFLCHSKEVGGAELFLERIAIAAVRCGVGGHVVCRPLPVLDEWCSRLIAAGVRVSRPRLSSPPALVRLFLAARRARACHLTLAFPVGKWQLVAALVALAAGRPPAVTHQLALDLRAVPLSAWGRRLWSAVYGAYGRVLPVHLAISDHARALLVELHGFPAGHVRVVHNGVDSAQFQSPPPSRRAALRRELVGADAPLLCSVARLSEQKGLFDLLSAARLVVDARPDARFVVLGEGGERAGLELRRRELGLEAAFLMPGAAGRAEVARWLAASTAFVLASHFEGGPAIAIMEAMASGCPGVVTDAGGVGELVRGAPWIKVVPPRAPEALAGSLLELLDDRSLGEQAAREGPQHIAGGWTWGRCEELTLAALDPELGVTRGGQGRPA